MATFQNLYHASEVLRRILVDETGVADTKVFFGPLPESAPLMESIYITLAWQTEHASHRNDGYQRNPDGTSTPPPVSLSLFYLITTYGGETTGNAETAHRVLGDVIRGVHARPVLDLTAGRLTATDLPVGPTPPIVYGLTNAPKGELTLAQVPLTPELMEKLFSLFQTKHRPFMVCEVGPVQLVSTRPDRAPGHVVAPGGAVLADVTTRGLPTIERVVPSTLPVGGRLRIDGNFDTSTDDFVVVVGGLSFTDSSITVVEAGRSVAVQLPAGTSSPLPPGVYDVSVASGKLASEPDQVQVIPPGSSSLDLPPSNVLWLDTDVVLTGQNLATADRVFFWLDDGLRAPGDLRWADRDLTTVSDTHLTIHLTGLAPGTYRLAARVYPPLSSVAQYTPYIVMEVRA
ncbi:MAG: hypothetical protein JWM10_354 [Myxococcaceae bacterium]|nr:hypothetical protein [Myxococcaceae bacterium]